MVMEKDLDIFLSCESLQLWKVLLSVLDVALMVIHAYRRDWLFSVSNLKVNIRHRNMEH